MTNIKKLEQTKYTNKLFGKEIELVIYSQKVDKNLLEDFYKEALRLQKIFNFYDAESELSVLNNVRTMEVSNELIEVLQKALKFSELTNGKYDVTLGMKFRSRKEGREIDVSCSYKDVEIKKNRVILKNKDALIDLGSIAKGYITDKLAEFLKSKGIKEFMIDSRGDITFAGDYVHIIEVQHPRENREILKIKIRNKSVATSGDYNQFSGSFDKSHIINQNDVISVSVVADSLEDADVYATALFVSDENQRNRILKNKEIRAFVIDKNLNTKMFNKFEEIVYNE